MGEIKVGEYIRTDEGTITKLKETDTFFKFDNYYVYRNWFNGVGNREKIVNHSFEPIDLIEEGDYVNGYKVINVINGKCCPSGKCVDIDSSMQSNECTFWESDIKSILTKQQFSNIEYKVVE